MGLGNGNAKQGDRGSNHSYEHRSLITLGKILAGLGAIVPAPPPPGGLASEATLLSLLNNLVASQDVEILLVRDDGAVPSPLVVQQIREYDQGTGVWTTRYEDVAGALYTPTGGGADLFYLDPSAVMNLVLAELQNKANLTDTQPVSLATVPLPTGASTEATLIQLRDKLNTLGQKASVGSAPVVLSTEQEAIIDAIKTAVEGTLAVSAASLPLPTGAATSALQTALNGLLVIIDGVLDNILLDTTAIRTATEGINTKLTEVVRTPTLTTVPGPLVGTATVAAGARSASFFNSGNGDITVAGGTLGSGLAVTFTAGGEEDTLAAITYGPLGGADELVITTIV